MSFARCVAALIGAWLLLNSAAFAQTGGSSDKDRSSDKGSSSGKGGSSGRSGASGRGDSMPTGEVRYTPSPARAQAGGTRSESTHDNGSSGSRTSHGIGGPNASSASGTSPGSGDAGSSGGKDEGKDACERATKEATDACLGYVAVTWGCVRAPNPVCIIGLHLTGKACNEALDRKAEACDLPSPSLEDLLNPEKRHTPRDLKAGTDGPQDSVAKADDLFGASPVNRSTNAFLGIR
jgi:hypothetical protein